MAKQQAFCIGVAITLLQIIFVCISQGKSPSFAAWKNLYHWDSEHYGNIAETGYFSKIPKPVGDTEYNRAKIDRMTNVAFFPGYPLAARTLLQVGFSKHWALLTVAATAAALFWTWLILLCEKLTIHGRTKILLIAFFLSHPAAFYLVAGYSESLFLAGLTGMILFALEKGERSALIAGAHGFATSLTRVFGAPLAILPLLQEFLLRLERGNSLQENPKKWLRKGLIAFTSFCGTLSFFLFCQWAFGWWDLYFIRQRAGWDLRPAWLLVSGNDFASIFWPKLTLLPEQIQLGLPTILNRLTTTILFWAFIVCIPLMMREWKNRTKGIALQTTLFITAGILFYLPLATLINADWRSMLRYGFPVVIFLSLAITPSLVSCARNKRAKMVLGTLAGTVTAGLLIVQSELISRFAEALWVA